MASVDAARSAYAIVLTFPSTLVRKTDDPSNHVLQLSEHLQFPVIKLLLLGPSHMNVARNTTAIEIQVEVSELPKISRS